MRSFFSRPIVAFFLSAILLSAIFFLIPINVFDGEYIFNLNGTLTPIKTKMSLSYFIGIGASPADLKDVVSFRLLPMGYFMVFLFLGALPALIAYRVHIANTQESTGGLIDQFRNRRK